MIILPGEDPKTHEDKVTAVLNQMPPDDLPAGRVKSWVIFAEWDDGQGEMAVTVESNCPPWTSEGLVMYAASEDLFAAGWAPTEAE